MGGLGINSFDLGELTVSRYGHATVKVEDGDFSVLVDPLKLEDIEANLVMITHSDPGHLDIETLEEICNDRTCVIVPESIDENKIPCRDVEKIGCGEKIDVFGVTVESIPMYNESHVRGEGSGYFFKMGTNSIYVAGDTGLINEASDLESKVDLAFLPIDGIYTMEVEEAVKMAVKIKPATVIPYHYGKKMQDSDPDLRYLKAELEDRNIECRILEICSN